MHQEELFTHIRRQAAVLDKVMADDLARTGDPELAEILRQALLAGGKRIRPLLVIVAAGLVDRHCTTRQALHSLAIAFEYLHAASLLHDDVIDGAEQRRGQPAANTVWGNSRVILAGDYLHARAMSLAGTIGGADCIAIIGRATAAMVEAEFLQHRLAEKKAESITDYFRVIEGKTAALIAAACETGAVFAGADEAGRAALRTYGANLGLAFQIVDDLLDYLGDPASTGKAVGNDFLEEKMTLPLLLALESTGDQGRQKILAALTRPAEHKDFDLMRDLIDQADGFTAARDRAATLIDEAIGVLAPFDDGPEKSLLTGLAFYVLNRQA